MTAARTAGRFRASALRARLVAGECALGLHCFSGSAATVEASGAGGFDFVILDQEHSPNDVTVAADLVRAADSVGLDLLVRVATLDRRLGALLDLGPAGLVVSQATAARMAAANALARFAPEGGRGACPAVRAAGYDAGDWAAFAAQANRELLLIALVEDRAGLADIDALAADPYVDALFVGAFDLAVSLGLPPGELRAPGLLEPFRTVLAAAARHGKPVMASAGIEGSDYGRWLQEQGVRILSCGADQQIIQRTARRLSGELRRPVP